MLYLIGMGLHDERDLSLKAVEALRGCERVYLESYTSCFNGDINRLQEMLGKEVVLLDRKDLEENPEENVLAGGEVGLIVMGDPMVATTHSDLVLRAREKGAEVKVIHSSSVYSAIAETGLQIYKFGRTTTIAYPEGDYFPKSPYEALKENHMRGLHTLLLLDVKADEGRYMTVNEGIKYLLMMEESCLQNQFKKDSKCVGVARLGGDTAIRYGTAEEVIKEEFGGPPHILIVPGKMHYMEEEMLKAYEV
ncbi:MAG: diphthine synthase [Candidatus Altiarchaeales archaeon]|nr:diphthine synthase [Candidatus Altiarchaeales archaeon]MBD3416967.1 diphthine synthase [Candidatus Altiarchaeales archaeon]